MTLKGSFDNARARTLLVLWALGGLDQAVAKGKIQPLTRTSEKPADYDAVFESLAGDEAIILTKQKNGKIKNVLLTHTGYELLGNWLRSPDFEFEGTQIGARLGNYLLKWIAHTGTGVAESVPKISSYDEFKAVALETYERLKRINALYSSGFIPIWHIRQELATSVKPEDFNTWLMQMQSDNIFHLRTGGSEATDEQKQASIYDQARGLLFTLVKVD
jgi:hypothetical protein